MSKATFSRDSSSYTATTHAGQRLKYERDVEPWMVNETIESGEVTDACRVTEKQAEEHPSDDVEAGDIKVTLRETFNYPGPVEVVIVADKCKVVTAIDKSE